METLIRRHITWRLIWVCTVCHCPTKRTLDIYGLKLTPSMLDNFACFFLSPCGFFFKIILFFKIKSFMGTISVKQFGLKSAWCFAWHNLYPICLQMLPADNKKPHKMEKSYTILFSSVTGFLFQNLEVYTDFTFIACGNVLHHSPTNSVDPRSPVEAAWSGSALFASAHWKKIS